MMRHFPIVLATLSLAVGRLACAANGQDDASNSAYSDGWQAGDNGGTGFGPWSFAFSGESAGLVHNSPQFIDNGPLGGNSLGAPAFALTTSGRPFFFDTSEATRPFAAPLAIGQSFGVDVDGSALDATAPGFSIGNTVQLMGASGERAALFTNNQFNNDNWTTGGVDTGIPAASAFHAEFTLTGVNTYDLEVTPIGGGVPLYSVVGAALSGTAGEPIASLRFSAYGTGSSTDGSRELFFDNLSLVPEPGSLTCALAATGAVGFRRRIQGCGRGRWHQRT